MQSPFANISPVVKNLLIINIICFLPFIFFQGQYDSLVVSHFALFYYGSPLFKPWQILTYMFLHGGWAHILFNMFALFSFGPILEYTVGSKKFFNLYFICGIGAALFQLLVMSIEMYHYTGQFIVPATFSSPDTVMIQKVSGIYYGPILGASGAIFGLLIAFGMLYPNMELMIMFIPVPVKAKYIIPVYVVIELFLGFGQFAGDNVAHFAHLGGALLGFIVVKTWKIDRNNNTYR